MAKWSKFSRFLNWKSTGFSVCQTFFVDFFCGTAGDGRGKRGKRGEFIGIFGCQLAKEEVEWWGGGGRNSGMELVPFWES